jgi:BirA family transcriptional regulator, biotin operon repressor / biotin---[acetyl-CoA-carboxylase] ligase
MSHPWHITDYDEVESTNSLAANSEPWTVVRAKRQNVGRGTHGRQWVSGDGGLWMSAVLPVAHDNKEVGTLPLLVGMALCEICREFGGVEVRLRWPNDLMIRNLKVAGILLDRPTPEKVIIGIGVNLTQNPALTMSELQGQAGRLQDLLPEVPDRDTLMMKILSSLASIHDAWQQHGFVFFNERLAACWGKSKKVEAQIDQEFVVGNFCGVDGQGNPILQVANGEVQSIPGAHIWKLRELE